MAKKLKAKNIVNIKSAKKVWVRVDCVLNYRISYMVETPEDSPEWALDVVTNEQAQEFSQRPLGEQIFAYHIVTEEEALKQCDMENDYAQSWTDKAKKKAFFTTQDSYEKESIIEAEEHEGAMIE